MISYHTQRKCQWKIGKALKEQPSKGLELANSNKTLRIHPAF